MILRALQLFASFFCLLTGSTAVWAQGTIQFGFEQFQIKDRPPFVTGSASVENSTSSLAFSQLPPFEGQKFLVAGPAISMQSPNGEPIQSFSLHLFLQYIPSPGPGFWIVTVGNQQLIRSSSGNWETIRGTFASPVQSLFISVSEGIETLPGSIAIDGVEFTTVPEPQTFWLLTLGLGAILLRRSKSLKTQSR